MMLNALLVVLVSLVAPPQGGAAAGGMVRLQLTKDDTQIRRSCQVVIAPDLVVADAAGDGVIQILADNITIEFAPGSVLRGAAAATPGDELVGYGIRLNGHTGVTLRNVNVTGYKAAVYGTYVDGLVIDGAVLSGNFRQRLKSTPKAEDGGDWLFPHDNRKNQWLEQYGAAVYIEDSKNIALSGIVVREGQNGIVLDRVNGSKVFDCDCSFLSGWGLELGCNPSDKRLRHRN